MIELLSRIWKSYKNIICVLKGDERLKTLRWDIEELKRPKLKFGDEKYNSIKNL